MVLAISDRAASSTTESPLTVTFEPVEATASANGSSKAEPTVSVRVRVWSANPRCSTLISYWPTLRYGNRKRPSLSVLAVLVKLVSVWRAMTLAPSTTAPLESETRPPMLA